MKEDKPPLGLIPYAVHLRLRVQAILDAMHRYSSVQKPIPIEWINELKDLLGYETPTA